MRLGSLIVCTTVCAWLSSPSLAATITASNDNRSGDISVSDGIGDPVEGGFNIVPGANEFDPITYNQCVTDAGRQACLNVTSSYLNLGSGNTTTGMTAAGTLSALKPAGPGFALTTLNLSYGITISGLLPGEKRSFDFDGSILRNGAIVAVSLNGPGVSVSFGETTNWDQVVELSNGTYILAVQAQALSFVVPAFNGSGEFSVELQEIPPACGPAASSCFAPHPSPGCNITACCEAICAADPFCCESAWDGLCVDAAEINCAQGMVTDPVPNPLNGHWYRLASPGNYANSVPFLLTSGYFPAAINDGSENAWVARNIASNVPGVGTLFPRIGLNDITSEGNFVWSTGQPLIYLNWAPGEPNNFANEDSVQLSGVSGLWNDISVNNSLHAIGEAFFPACGPNAGSCFTLHGPGCNDESCCNEVCFQDPFCCNTEWDLLCVDRAQANCTATTFGPVVVNPSNGHKYVSVSSGSWLQAQRLATFLGGNLVSMNSAAENEWVRLNFHAVPGNPQQYMIGFNDYAIEGVFQWTSHEAVTYSNWTPGEPNNAGGAEDTTLMEASGTWNDIPSSLTGSAIIEIPCSGDLNNDGIVGGADLAILLGAWGSFLSASDLNFDSRIDAADLALLLGAWGSCPTSNACVDRATAGSDQPGCTICVCELDPFCCDTRWDSICVGEASLECNAACQCGG